MNDSFAIPVYLWRQAVTGGGDGPATEFQTLTDYV